jgi:hypothetical protein
MPWTPVTPVDRHSVAIGEMERQHRDEMQACFRDGVQGDMFITFDVASDGSSSNLAFAMSNALEQVSNETQSCERATFASIHFPPGEGSIHARLQFSSLHPRPPASPLQ